MLSNLKEFKKELEINIIMVCSHCQGIGHTYRTCPTITPQEKEKKEKEIKEKKEAVIQRRIQRVQQQQQQQQQEQQEQQEQPDLPLENVKTDYNISNMTDSEMVIYWSMNGNDIMKRFLYIKPHTNMPISCIKDKHTLFAFPFLEVSNNGSVEAYDEIAIPNARAGDRDIDFMYTCMFNIKMDEYDGSDIIIDNYEPIISEIDKWKNSALKAKFLLDQIHKMTGGGKRGEFENIEPFLDMIQDIEFPETSEIDKERAGVPSLLTNVT
jgi:hypothetical protein